MKYEFPFIFMGLRLADVNCRQVATIGYNAAVEVASSTASRRGNNKKLAGNG
jgi:hypothetical protein